MSYCKTSYNPKSPENTQSGDFIAGIFAGIDSSVEQTIKNFGGDEGKKLAEMAFKQKYFSPKGLMFNALKGGGNFIGLGITIGSVYLEAKKGNYEHAFTEGMAGLGSMGGAVLGAKIGILGGPIGIAVGAAIGGALGALGGREVGEGINEQYHHWYCSKSYGELDPYHNNNAHGYDPLIVNLDGKGIQTIAPSSISARFDHNADGISTATGWTAAGNGILALDLNNNGKIDSGKEIFGNHSVLSNGTTADHGYAALAELDSNHDNLINQADELFSSLKVWQDINQDGISQSNELFTLQALGIQSLNLEHQENSKDLGNGNRLTHIGSYTKTDGTTGEMGDVEFAANHLYSRYTDTVELTPEQLQAPNLQGLGRLRDLRLVTLN